MYSIVQKYERLAKQDNIIISGINSLEQAQKQADSLNENLDEYSQYFYYIDYHKAYEEYSINSELVIKELSLLTIILLCALMLGYYFLIGIHYI